MKSVTSTVLQLRSKAGRGRGALLINTLPRKGDLPVEQLWECGLDDGDSDGKRVFLLEGYEYRYRWIELGDEESPVSVDPEELFNPDSSDGISGRLKPGLATGLVTVAVRFHGEEIGELVLDIRSSKLAYESEYRWMLRDIAEQMTELVMNRFASSQARFEQDHVRDAVTLYQRFAFLKALIESDAFKLAVAEVLARPHISWKDHGTLVSPGWGLKADSMTLRQLVRAGPRVRWNGGVLNSLPAQVEQFRSEVSHDTTPNRFVKFALERWSDIVRSIDESLSKFPESALTRRGRREAQQVSLWIDTVLSSELLRRLPPLTHFPAGDQVLQKRAGYRDIFRAYLEFELAARLSWKNPEGAHLAGQRDVATLYEYWTFIEVAKVVADLVGQKFDMAPLIDVRRDGLSVGLEAGKETVLKGRMLRHNRSLDIELCFNRTYAAGALDGSWTKSMRPDCSLRISASDEGHLFEPIVIHFDAKYRVEHLAQLFGIEDDVGEFIEKDYGSLTRRGGARRTDLLKMHAYRDAIRRTAGAYVLYPGGDQELGVTPFNQYHELLPGLGAFVLRPTSNGETKGSKELACFLHDVIEHVTTDLTKHERGRAWLKQVYEPPTLQEMSRLELPSDCQVLLGFVKSSPHFQWIIKNGLYNVRKEPRRGGVRAESALWKSQLVLLYCPISGEIAFSRIVSHPVELSCIVMQTMRYPDPQGSYWCVQLGRGSLPPKDWDLTADIVDRYVQNVGAIRGAPIICDTIDLIELSVLQGKGGGCIAPHSTGR